MISSRPSAYLETRVDVPRDLTDTVCDFIVEHLANGIVLEEEEDSTQTGIVFYVPDSDTTALERFEKYLADLLSERSLGKPIIRQRSVANVEWVEKYRESVKPIFIGDDIVIRPPWAEAIGRPYEIIIEPRLAFGTGSHATTFGSLLAVRRAFRAGARFLDMGTGSGVLSILADKMGACHIKAVDYDPVAVDNCRENFQINGVAAPYEIALGSIEACNSDTPYEFVAANIILSTILEMMDRLLALTAPGGVLVLSGLLEQDKQAVCEALEARGQNRYTVDQFEQWLTLSVTRV
jgi:ribosomal protein L11 methyltransferase